MGEADEDEVADDPFEESVVGEDEHSEVGFTTSAGFSSPSLLLPPSFSSILFIRSLISRRSESGDCCLRRVSDSVSRFR